jgi:hypothetical protein
MQAQHTCTQAWVLPQQRIQHCWQTLLQQGARPARFQSLHWSLMLVLPVLLQRVSLVDSLVLLQKVKQQQVAVLACALHQQGQQRWRLGGSAVPCWLA